MYLPNYESMSTSTRVILDKKVRVSSNYLYVKIGGSTSILAPILEYYSSIMLGTFLFDASLPRHRHDFDFTWHESIGRKDHGDSAHMLAMYCYLGKGNSILLECDSGTSRCT